MSRRRRWSPGSARIRLLFMLVLLLVVAGVTQALPVGTNGDPEAGSDRTGVQTLIPAVGVLFGAEVGKHGTETFAAAQVRAEEAVGRKLDLDRIYRQWDAPQPDPVAVADVRRGRVPLLSIRPQRNDGTRIPWATVASGSLDADIRAQADGLKQLGTPLFLIFHHEADIEGGYGTPVEFVAAWRHYVQVFRDDGVTNVSFVWNLVPASFTGDAARGTAMYPGDDWVDWMAVDAYNWFGCTAGTAPGWRSLADAIASWAAWAQPHGKPLMLAEWGSVEDPAQAGRKAQWLRDALDAPRRWPQLKAMSYFDTTGSCRWSVDSTPTARAAFNEIAHQPITQGRPNALLRVSRTIGGAPLPVTFDASRTTGPLVDGQPAISSWTVDFGDGSAPATGTGPPPGSIPHSYAVGAYTARLTVTDASGAGNGDVATVQAVAAPTVTGSTTGVTGTAATLQGWVNTNNLPAAVYFQWGTTAAYGSRSAPAALPAHDYQQKFTSALSGLTPGTRYHWSVVASTDAGSTVGADGLLDTAGPPTLEYRTPTSLASTSVQLGGAVHPHSLPTLYYYGWGPTAAYGRTTGTAPLAAATWARSAPATVSGLTAGTAYHYRLVATNSLGTVVGPDQVVTTRRT